MLHDLLKLNICFQITIKYTILFNPIVVMFHAAFPPPKGGDPSPPSLKSEWETLIGVGGVKSKICVQLFSPKLNNLNIFILMPEIVVISILIIESHSSSKSHVNIDHLVVSITMSTLKTIQPACRHQCTSPEDTKLAGIASGVTVPFHKYYHIICKDTCIKCPQNAVLGHISEAYCEKCSHRF